MPQLYRREGEREGGRMERRKEGMEEGGEGEGGEGLISLASSHVTQSLSSRHMDLPAAP